MNLIVTQKLPRIFGNLQQVWYSPHGMEINSLRISVQVFDLSHHVACPDFPFKFHGGGVPHLEESQGRNFTPQKMLTPEQKNEMVRT
jgi:hypothetical protein